MAPLLPAVTAAVSGGGTSLVLPAQWQFAPSSSSCSGAGISRAWVGGRRADGVDAAGGVAAGVGTTGSHAVVVEAQKMRGGSPCAPHRGDHAKLRYAVACAHGYPATLWARRSRRGRIFERRPRAWLHCTPPRPGLQPRARPPSSRRKGGSKYFYLEKINFFTKIEVSACFHVRIRGVRVADCKHLENFILFVSAMQPRISQTDQKN